MSEKEEQSTKIFKALNKPMTSLLSLISLCYKLNLSFFKQGTSTIILKLTLRIKHALSNLNSLLLQKLMTALYLVKLLMMILLQLKYLIVRD